MMWPLRSPSVMAWTALMVRLAGFALLLPVALTHLSSAEVSVWLLFNSIASLQLLVDFGFSATFSREIAYGFAGGSTLASTGEARAVVGETPGIPDWAGVSKAMAAMRWLYGRLGLVAFCLLALLGTVAVMGPIARIDAPAHAWFGWCVVVASTAGAIVGNSNSTLLVGANRIDLQKRWEAANGLVFIPLQLFALFSGAGLLGLVVIAQLGALSQVFINWRLARRVTAGKLHAGHTPAETRVMLGALWPAAWRTAVGTISAFGVAQGMAIAMANLLVASEAASVQLALRVVQVLSQFAQVPFYTKIPVFNRLRATGANDELMARAVNAIRNSLGIFVLLAVAIDLGVRPLLGALGSRTHFPDRAFWAFLVLAYLSERVGAMHVQLLMTSNRMIAHVANLVTALIWITCVLAMWSKLGALALPVGMLVAYGGFYAPFASGRSRSAIGAGIGWRFEARTSLLPIVLLVIYFAVMSQLDRAT